MNRLTMATLTPRFIESITAAHGPTGEMWLAQLPELIADCERRWDITVGPPWRLYFTYVAPAVRSDGAEFVLKLGVPNPEITAGIAALRLYDGHGAARVIAGEPEAGILLIERLQPGTTLADEGLTDEAATVIIAERGHALWRPLPESHPFPDLDRWTRSLRTWRDVHGGGTGPLPANLIDRANAILADLLSSQGAPVLLHGDLHHFNVLRAEREPWLVIDPKGVAGEPAYEIGPMMLNELPDLADAQAVRRALDRRLELCAGLWRLDRDRLAAWTFVEAVLSACWSLEDGGEGWDAPLVVAQDLQPRL
jgi:streptomycin 6-kinase